MNQFFLATITVVASLVIIIPSGVNADRLTVVASVFPLYDFAREVAGPAADVRLLLPPGVDPHSWEPRPSDIVDLSQSDIFLYISEKMEPWAGSIAKAIRGRNITIVEIMENLDFSGTQEQYGAKNVDRDGLDHGEDPHFWLDLSLSAQAVEMIGKLLANHDPPNRDHYIANARAYARKLDQLDEAFKTGLMECSSRQLVTGGHAAFGHLTRRYGLEQISVYGLSPDAEPTPRHLAGIVRLVNENNVQTIFSEELMNPRMAQVLSQETGTQIMVLNPGGNLTAAQGREGLTFLEIMRRNLDTLREGLDCE